jgi:signal transduction histidine kinase
MIKKEVNLRLSVCQSIVQMHGGDMSIEHKSNCTQFTILLPVKQGEKK